MALFNRDILIAITYNLSFTDPTSAMSTRIGCYGLLQERISKNSVHGNLHEKLWCGVTIGTYFTYFWRRSFSPHFSCVKISVIEYPIHRLLMPWCGEYTHYKKKKKEMLYNSHYTS